MATGGANVSGTACLVNMFSGLPYIMLLNSMFAPRPGTIYYYMVITEVQTPWLSTQQSHHSLCTQTRALLLPACCPDVLQTISRENRRAHTPLMYWLQMLRHSDSLCRCWKIYSYILLLPTTPLLQQWGEALRLELLTVAVVLLNAVIIVEGYLDVNPLKNRWSGNFLSALTRVVLWAFSARGSIPCCSPPQTCQISWWESRGGWRRNSSDAQPAWKPNLNSPQTESLSRFISLHPLGATSRCGLILRQLFLEEWGSAHCPALTLPSVFCNKPALWLATKANLKSSASCCTVSGAMLCFESRTLMRSKHSLSAISWTWCKRFMHDYF